MSIFSTVKAEYAKTSLFNLSHEVKNTMKFGQLIPFLTQEVLPGDIWRVRTEILTRLMAMKSPIMHNVNVYTHFFFVPYRLLWKDWEQFVTQSLNGTYKNDVPELPIIEFSTGSAGELLKVGSLADYLGVKSSGSWEDDCYLNALPFLAYNKIWSDYYRDENLQADYKEDIYDLPTGITNSDDIQQMAGLNASFFDIKYRAFGKDYFTSALPWTQKGDSMVLPISGEAPVSGQLVGETSVVGADRGGVLFGSNVPGYNSSGNYVPSGQNKFGQLGFSYTEDQEMIISPVSSDDVLSPALRQSVIGTADLSNASAVTINELRTLNALQKWQEANARGGSRYIEQLMSHFGVVSDDARLQRAEYLGGGKSPILISEVLQTSGSTIEGSDTPQGNMAGHGLGASRNHAFTRRFKEHGILMGIMSVMPKANYMQGCPRMFLKRDVFDFGWPLLAHLGEQPIYDVELFNAGVPPTSADMKVFGYTPRYAEYKFIPDQIAGQFRSSLDFWHLAREFQNQPNLNGAFISTRQINPRVFADSSTDYILNQMFLDIKCTRKLPKFGTPRLS